VGKSIFQIFGGKEKPAPAVVAVPAEAPKAAPVPPVDPDVIAVIATMLDAEFRLRVVAADSRLTFSPGAAQGWSEWGRSLVRPFQGEVNP